MEVLSNRLGGAESLVADRLPCTAGRADPAADRPGERARRHLQDAARGWRARIDPTSRLRDSSLICSLFEWVTLVGDVNPSQGAGPSGTPGRSREGTRTVLIRVGGSLAPRRGSTVVPSGGACPDSRVSPVSYRGPAG